MIKDVLYCLKDIYSASVRFFQKGITTTQTEPAHTETSPLSKSMTFYCALARFAYWGCDGVILAE